MVGPFSPRLVPRRDWTHSLLGNTQLSSLVLQQVAVDRHSQSVRPNFQHISVVVVTGGGRGEPATHPAWLV